jgi:DNA-binding NarL/FixJ family response regulator
MKINLGIIEDNEAVRTNYVEFFNLQPEFQVVFAFGDLKINALHAQTVRPDIVLLDIGLPSGSSLKSVSKLKQFFPNAKIIILTASSDQATILKSINNGVDGYLIKNSSLHYIYDTLKQTYQGGFPLSPLAAKYLLNTTPAEKQLSNVFADLTSREMELVRLLKTGMSNKMASDHLSVTFFTVNHHLKSIYRKLNIHSKSELIALASILENSPD